MDELPIYRAWHKRQKKMYSPEEMGEDQLTLMPNGRGFVNVSGDDTKLSQIDDGKNIIPLSFTTVKDVVGNRIFNGDIVRYLYKKDGNWESGFTIVISWNLSGCNWNIWPPHSPNDNNWEVIGNIYENPELLEVK